MDLDHVALGLHDANPVISTLVADLGATVLRGGVNPGFRVTQLRVGQPAAGEYPGDGMTVELIEPWAVHRFDFLARFLERNGDGPHHLTFKVGDIRAQLARMEAAGFQPTSTNLDNPWWREAFFHPKAMFGTVVQLAQSDFDHDEFEADPTDTSEFGPQRWWAPPPAPGSRQAALRRVVLGVHDVADAAALYEGLLGGTRVGEGAGDADGPVDGAVDKAVDKAVDGAVDGAVELAWAGGGLRLEHRPDRPAGVDRLECDWDGPEQRRTIGGVEIHLSAAAGRA